MLVLAPLSMGIAPLRRFALFADWSISIEEQMETTADGDARALFTTGRTMWSEVLKTGESRADAIGRLAHMHTKQSLATFVEHDGGVSRIAFLQPQADAEKRASGLLAAVVIDGEHLLLGFYFDDPNDLAWALRMWRSVECSAPIGAG